MSLPLDGGDIHSLPMRDALLQHLDRLSHLSFALFSSLAVVPSSSSSLPPSDAQNPDPSTQPQPLQLTLTPSRSLPDPALFLSLDRSLSEALLQARVHQLRHRKIEQLKREVGELEEEIRGVVRVLEEGRAELGELVEEGEEDLKTIERAQEHPLKYLDILQYAQHLATYTSLPPSFPPYRLAPPGSGSGPEEEGEEKPPFHMHAPTQEMLRRGRLNAEGGGGGMSFLGREGEVGVEQEQHQLPEASQGHGQEGVGAPTGQGRAARPAAADVFNDLDLNLDL